MKDHLYHLIQLSLTNLSQLLQCQLVDVELPAHQKIPQIKAIVAINSFGGLLLKKGGDSTIIDFDKKNALDYAKNFQHKDVIRLLGKEFE